MKKLILFFALILIGNLALAQYQGQFRLQYGNDMGFSSGLFGMNIGGEYFPVDQISFAPNLSVLFPETGKASNLHLDARYYFTDDKLELYALLGYANFRRRYEFNPEKTYENTGTMNIGAGVLYKFIEELGLNAEIKLQPQNYNEFIIKLGISYFIN
ncbi:hypothetical protein [Lunatibacter salilacus]|uniref:hypothetical protein n=1 Tax=Lunatibacter salilacus TaxID=2483804 RepID=UPI00131D1434|nr:hypothetical protein [Lunatibacter salilacus]